jgi:murein DD-endopeptidase MepM/ murein hydrolase activator NlpD
VRCVEGFEGMRLAFWSSKGRGAWGVLTAAGVAFCVAGCSSGTSSRFDFPAFGLADNTPSAGTDPSTTASIPMPPESVYSPAGGYQGQGQVSRTTLPPPDYSPKPASYSPTPPPDRSRIRSANYSGGLAPHASSAPWTDAKPVAGLHVKVGKGETLSMLSRRYGVPVETIMGANNLSDGRLHPGQELVIPGAKAAQTAEAAPPKPAPEAASSAPTPGGSGTPQVRKVKTTTITAPGVSSGQGSPGQGTSLAEEEDNQANDAKAKGKTDQKAKPAAAEAAASPEVTGEESPRIASNDQLPTPDPMSGNSFRWPVKGRVVSEFGAKPDGGHNDGIDLAVPQGTPVQAAENGVVAYAGSELKGYGNLVLIRHANNWVSAYAHNEEILVKRGDKVRRGQVIAKAGATGAVSQPEVHFELRKGSRPVDPTKFMSSEAASN